MTFAVFEVPAQLLLTLPKGNAYRSRTQKPMVMVNDFMNLDLARKV